MGFFDNVKTIIGSKPAAESITTPNTQQIGQAKKILIVEDDDAIRQLYVEILSPLGYQITQAQNGQLGLESIKSSHPDLVLLDLMMPVMDGKAMLHAVRTMPEFATLPVIILTNAGDVESMRETKVYDKANEFLIKSNVTPDEIIQKVKSIIG